jgi:hypothetical protein
MLASVNGKASDAENFGLPLLKIMVKRVAAAMAHEEVRTRLVVEKEVLQKTVARPVCQNYLLHRGIKKPAPWPMAPILDGICVCHALSNPPKGRCNPTPNPLSKHPAPLAPAVNTAS